MTSDKIRRKLRDGSWEIDIYRARSPFRIIVSDEDVDIVMNLEIQIQGGRSGRIIFKSGEKLPSLARWIMEAKDPNVHGQVFVIHLNGDKSDLRRENLIWSSASKLPKKTLKRPTLRYKRKSYCFNTWEEVEEAKRFVLEGGDPEDLMGAIKPRQKKYAQPPGKLVGGWADWLAARHLERLEVDDWLDGIRKPRQGEDENLAIALRESRGDVPTGGPLTKAYAYSLRIWMDRMAQNEPELDPSEYGMHNKRIETILKHLTLTDPFEERVGIFVDPSGTFSEKE